MAYATPAQDDPSGAVATLSARYVLPGQQRLGAGAALLRTVARELSDLALGTLRVDVLTANLPARRFYEAMGGIEAGGGVLDEEGHSIPVTAYEWRDLRTLANGRAKQNRPRSRVRGRF